MGYCATSQKTMLQLLSRLDRFLVAGQYGVCVGAILRPPGGPEPSRDGNGAAESLGAVALVGVDYETSERWKLGIGCPCAVYEVLYQGPRPFAPGLELTTSDAYIKTPEGSVLFRVEDIFSISVVTKGVVRETRLWTAKDVGLLIRTHSDSDILFDLAVNGALMSVPIDTLLSRLSLFLDQPLIDRTPISIEIKPNCNVKFQVDPGTSLVFQPTSDCRIPIKDSSD